MIFPSIYTIKDIEDAWNKGKEFKDKEWKKKIINALKLCKICRGTHGKWIDKETLKKELLGDKNE
jgi:hypothetical protein